ncbi:hypothetical protein GCM10027360_78390 [Amycolatopsis echigonensis]
MLVLGSGIPIGQPLHRRVWQSSGIGYDEGPAVSVESHPVLLAKARAGIHAVGTCAPSTSVVPARPGDRRGQLCPQPDRGDCGQRMIQNPENAILSGDAGASLLSDDSKRKPTDCPVSYRAKK